MNKIDNIPQDIWDKARSSIEDEYNWTEWGVPPSMIGSISRAIMAATAEERGAVLSLVADDYGGFEPDTDFGVGYHLACQNLAGAIRARGTDEQR